MTITGYRTRVISWIAIALTCVAFGDSVMGASVLIPNVNAQKSSNSYSLPVELSIRGASAGVTTDYYEQALVEVIKDSKMFKRDDGERYSLDIRIVRVETPTMSTSMTVSMKTIWKLHCSCEESSLFEERIVTTYTGGLLEGGIIGANRVRVAMEGASKESIRAGMKLLSALNLKL